MSLADYYGGSYFPAGKHRVTISGTRFFTYNSGSPGVEFAIGDGRRAGKLAFCLHEKALWKLANFAADVGIDPKEMRRIDPKTKRGFDLFINKSFVAVVEKVRGADDKEYAEVTDWEPLPAEFNPHLPAVPPPSDNDEPPVVDEDQIPATAGGPVDEDYPPMRDSDIPF